MSAYHLSSEVFAANCVSFENEMSRMDANDKTKHSSVFRFAGFGGLM